MKKIIRKNSVTFASASSIAVGMTLLCGVASASVFEQLAAVANSALPTYGRIQAMGYRPELARDQIDSAFRQAMLLGARRAVANAVQAVSQNEGLELSADLRRARKDAARLGEEQTFIRFGQQLQRAHSEAMQITAELFKAALVRVDFIEPRMLLVSHDTAIVDYLRHRVSTSLRRQLEPVVTDILSQSGALENGTAIAEQIQFGNLLNVSAIDHVVARCIDDFFLHLESEEKAIRYDPEYRSTSLLRLVFG